MKPARKDRFYCVELRSGEKRRIGFVADNRSNAKIYFDVCQRFAERTGWRPVLIPLPGLVRYLLRQGKRW